MLFLARKVNCIVAWCITEADAIERQMKADGKADEEAQGGLCGCDGVA